MTAVDDGDAPFRFEYQPGTIRFGRGAAESLGRELADVGSERALLVTGTTVGSTPAVMDPVRAGLGDRLAAVFAETTPNKRLATAIRAAGAYAEHDADAIVAVGGGSSLDVATMAAVVAAGDRNAEDLGEEFERTGTIAVPDGPLPPVVAVPTTLAGAELSDVAGITAGPEHGLVEQERSGGVGDPRLAPAAVVADPALVETTPDSVLAPSAMNGFDKGIETLYARDSTPITDATAAAGLARLRRWLPELDRREADPRIAEGAVAGTLLCQYGISRPDAATLSLVHAFGHALRDHGDMHQGRAHAIVAPGALELLFDRVDGRRLALARALDVPLEDRDADGLAAGVIAAVAAVRDGLGLDDRLRDVEGLDRDDLPAVAESTLADSFMGNGPAGFEPTSEDLLGVLEAAW